MENKDLDKWLATKVMGMVEGETIGAHPRYYFEKIISEFRNHKPIMLIEDWHPTEDIAQAFMCLEKDNTVFELDRDSTGYYDCCIKVDEETYILSGFYKSASMAMCIAKYKEKAKENDGKSN